MGRLSYMMKRAAKMDYGAMLKTANMLHKKTGKSRIWLLSDMAKCAARYNAGYIDYKIAEMYRLTDAQWSELMSDLGVPGIPAYILINKDGSVAFSNLTEGGYPGNDMINNLIEVALTK